MNFNHDSGLIDTIQTIDVTALPPLGGAAGVLTITGTGAVYLTSGTTAQRPTGLALGMIRGNSDLSIIEGYNGSAWVDMTKQGTVTSVSATGSTGLTVSGSPITSSGTITFTLGSELQGLSSLATSGIVVRTAAGAYTGRTLAAANGTIVVTNGDGIAGAPTIGLGTLSLGSGGTFQKLTVDSYGRVSQVTSVVASDITTLVDGTYVNVTGDTMTGSLTFSGGATVTGLPTPSASSDAVPKTYVDSLVAGMSWKNSVRAATTAAGTLASSFANGSVVDGVTLATGDRILIKNQATGTENGIYVVNASGAPTRASDADVGTELVNASVYVDQGTVNADTGWVQTSNGPITVGTTSLSFAQFSGSSTYSAGTGLTLTGNVFSLTSPVATTLGGTGLSSIGTANQILGVNAGATGLEYKSVSAGSGVSVTNGANSITIANTGVTSNVAGTGISVSGATGAVTITNTGVTSVTGTANQVTVSANTGAVTLSLPSAVSTGSLTLTGLTANSFLFSGTGGALTTTTAPTNGQLLIGSTGAAPVAATLTAGSGVSVTNGAGSITIANTGVTSIVAGTGVSVSGATGAVTVSNTGVTSVGLSLPGIFSVSGSPVTTTGTLTATLASQTANTVFIAPNGSAGSPTFRALVAADLPIKLYAESSSSPTAPSATGTNSVAVGSGAAASATNSVAQGAGTSASIYATQVYGNGSFATAGDAQTVTGVLRNITTTATVTELFLDGTAGTQRLVLPNNSNWTFSVVISARRTDAVGGAAGYKFEGVIRKDTTSASTTFTGSPAKTVLGETNVGWDASLTADTTNGALVVKVTGEASKTIRWVATVTATQVTN